MVSPANERYELIALYISATVFKQSAEITFAVYQQDSPIAQSEMQGSDFAKCEDYFCTSLRKESPARHSLGKVLRQSA